MFRFHIPMLRMGGLLVIALFLSVGILFVNVGRTMGGELDRKTEDQIASVEHARCQLDAVKNYEKLFAQKDKRLVRLLKTHSATGVALGAAWKEMRMTQASTDRDAVAAMLQHPADRFLGFVEGRLRTASPPWWEETIRGAETLLDGDVVVVPQRKLYPKKSLGVWLQNGTSLEERNNRVILSVNGEAIYLPSAMVSADLPSARCVSALISKDRGIIAFHHEMASSYSLICVDRISAKVVWRSDVWVIGATNTIYSGCGFFHAVGIAVVDKQVLVFGAGNHCVYIEGFSYQDGTPLFRFGSLP